MKKAFLLLAFCGLFAAAACAPMRPGVPPEKKASERLYMSAEKEFEKGRDAKALSLYEQYLSEYPSGSRVPGAHLKIGIIRSRHEEYSRAEKRFRKVMSEYPESRYAGRAGAELLAVLYNSGRFREAVKEAEDVFSYQLSDRQFVRARLAAGDACMALEMPAKAYENFVEAYKKARPEKIRESVIPRIKAAVNKFSAEMARQELAGLEGRFPGGYLMYQLGMSYIAEGSMDNAAAAFSEFLEKYPGHELSDDARRKLEQIKASGAARRVRIGCLLPLSGRYKKIGQRALNGIELALSHAGGQQAQSGPQISLVVADTASDRERAVKAVESLDKKNVPVIVGAVSAARAAAEECQERGIPIAVLSQAEEITGVGDFVFRNFITPEMQAKRLAEYAVSDLNIERFAILYPDEPYGRGFMNLFWEELESRGARVTGVEKYNPAHTDFSEPIKKLAGLYYEVPEDIKAEEKAGPLANPGVPPEAFPPEYNLPGESSSREAGAEEILGGLAGRLAAKAAEDDGEPEPIVDFDAVFIPDSPDKAGLLIPQLAFYDIEGVLCLGTNLWHSKRFIRMAPRHVQGAVCTAGFFPDSPADNVRRFVDSFKKVYGREPGLIEAAAYDTAGLIIEVINRSSYFCRTCIRAELSSMEPYRGVTGRTWFDGKGEAVKELYLLKVKGDRFVDVNRY